MRKIMVLIIVIVLAIGSGIFWFIHQPQFGSAPSGSRLEKIQASPHYRDGKFQNIESVENIVEGGNQFSATWEFLFGSKEEIVPDKAIPFVKTDLKVLDKDEDIVVWLGHSSFYMQLNGYRILIDPVFSSYAAPLSFINKAFEGTNPYTAADMPDIDLLVMSHDHWDHLDYQTVMDLQPKVKSIACPLGVGAYFEQWGFRAEQLYEGDWFEKLTIAPDFTLHIVPAQHFSGRMLEKDQTLWAGFVFITSGNRVFYSGDSGYGSHFAEIGQQLGGFDLAIMENGQYNKQWPRIHMMPEEAAQAAVDVGAKKLLTGHNGKFALSRHEWDEPYKRITAASRDKKYQLVTPKIGEIVHIEDDTEKFSPWWESVE